MDPVTAAPAASPAAPNTSAAPAAPAAAAPSQGQPGVPPASPSGNQPAPTLGPDGQPVAVAPNPNDNNLATLRTNYERYRKFGEPEVVERQTAAAKATFARATELSTALGYTPESLEEAFHADPVGTLLQLEREAQEANRANPQDKAVADLVKKQVQAALAPVQQKFVQEQAKAANVAFTNEFGRLLGEHALFKGATDVPEDVRTVLFDMVSESFKYDKEGLARLVNEGKVSDVAKYFDGTLERFQKVMNSYNAWQAKRAGGPGPNTGAPAPNAEPLSIDDIINGTDKAKARMTSMRT